MNREPLVSIIVPCYNGERLIWRFFDSILRQTYSQLELIFINDGSTDRTEEIALGYSQALKKKGVEFVYLYQENAGQAAAINKGLEIFRGEYIMFSDSDDWLSDNCVESKLTYLRAHPEKMFVLGKAAFVQEEQTDKIERILQRKNTENGWLFDDLVFEGDGYYAPGCYLMRTSAFLEVHPDRKLYESRGGQNWQILLPLTYRYECGFIDDIVYYIVVHQDSHSRVGKTYEEYLERTYEHEDILNNVLGGIEMPEQKKAEYLKHVRIKYYKRRLHLAATYQKKDVVVQQYRALCAETTPSWMDRVDHLRGKYGAVHGLIKLVRLPWRILLKLKGQ